MRAQEFWRKGTQGAHERSDGSVANARSWQQREPSRSPSRTPSRLAAPPLKVREMAAAAAAAASTAVYDLIKHRNGPLNIQLIVDNLQKHKVKKTMAQKAIDGLVANQKVVMKEFGKQKIYFLRQDNLEKPSEEELRDFKDKTAALKSALAKEKADVQALKSELARVKREKTEDGTCLGGRAPTRVTAIAIVSTPEVPDRAPNGRPDIAPSPLPPHQNSVRRSRRLTPRTRRKRASLRGSRRAPRAYPRPPSQRPARTCRRTWSFGRSGSAFSAMCGVKRRSR